MFQHSCADGGIGTWKSWCSGTSGTGDHFTCFTCDRCKSEWYLTIHKSEVMTYEEVKAAREKGLEELATQAQELDMGYENEEH